MKEEIESWKASVCIDRISRGDEDELIDALEATPAEIDSMGPRELDRQILILSSYYLYLKYQLGQLNSRINYIDTSLQRVVAFESHKIKTGYVQEKKALVLASNIEYAKMEDTIAKERAKKDMLEPICEGVWLKIDTLKRMADRRSRDKYVN